MEEKKSFWTRIRRRYRLAIMDDENLRDVFHIRLNGLGTFVVLTLLFALVVCSLSALIIFTPIRNVLPGYSESIRQQLIVQSVKADSLQQALMLQRQYLDVIKQLTAGEVESDSVQSLDSLQIVAHQRELQEARSQATEEFVAQYEAKAKDDLQLFGGQAATPVVSFFRPVHGIVEPPIREPHHAEILLRTAPNENVCSVLGGTIVLVESEGDEALFTMVVQHGVYVSIYRHVGAVLKTVGTQVRAGETIGIVKKEHLLGFELWKNGEPVRPEEVIVF